MGKKVTAERAPSFKVDYYVSRCVCVCKKRWKEGVRSDEGDRVTVLLLESASTRETNYDLSWGGGGRSMGTALIKIIANTARIMRFNQLHSLLAYPPPSFFFLSFLFYHLTFIIREA